MEFDKTMHFEVEKIENLRTKEILKEVYEALQEKGYNLREKISKKKGHTTIAERREQYAQKISKKVQSVP